MSIKITYEKKLESQLNSWEEEYQVLKTRADQIERKPDSELSHALNYLNEKREVAKAKLQQLKTIDELEWEALQDDIDGAWSNLGIALKSLEIQLEKHSQ